MNKIKLQKPEILIFTLIILVGIYLRFYDLTGRFEFGHDHDLAAWFVRDVLVNRHLRLIGQETSTRGIFIGPLYYYVQIPFFLIFRMNPIALSVTSSLIGVFGMFSVYFVISRTLGKRVALIALTFYALSYFVVSNDREAVPTTPVIIWSVWYFYALELIHKAKFKQGFLLYGILAGLIWHLNVTLVLLVPLVFLAIKKSNRRVKTADLTQGAVALILLISPFLLFEIRHNFIQAKSFFASIVVNQGDIYTGFEKVRRVLYIANKNVVSFVWGTELISEKFFGLAILTFIFLLLSYKRKITKFQSILFSLWLLLYLLFFSIYSKAVSEYYLNGLFVVYLVLISAFLDYLIQQKVLKWTAFLFFSLYAFFNIQKVLLSYHVVAKNYVNKKALVSEIKNDMQKKTYDCAAISYITDPGYDLGYRYFFYWQGVKLKNISENVPVYSIVFPLGKDGVKHDVNFGALGLIYPEDKDYSIRDVEKACQGDNYNLTQPMFGFNN
jgi:hypothetical protein